MDAAIKAKAIESVRGVHATCHRLNIKIPSRTKFRIMAVKQQIQHDRMHRASPQPETSQLADIHQLSLDQFVCKRPHQATIMGNLKSNKRLHKPD